MKAKAIKRRPLLVLPAAGEVMRYTLHGPPVTLAPPVFVYPRSLFENVVNIMSNFGVVFDFTSRFCSYINFGKLEALAKTMEVTNGFKVIILRGNGLDVVTQEQILQDLEVADAFVAPDGLSLDLLGNQPLFPDSSAIWDFAQAGLNSVIYQCGQYPALVSGHSRVGDYSKSAIKADVLGRFISWLASECLELGWTLNINGNCAEPDETTLGEIQHLIDDGGWEVNHN